MNISKYFLIAFSFACLGTLVMPSNAATKTAASKKTAAKTTAVASKPVEPAESRTGARFVISNPIGGNLPTTLYYRDTDGYFYPIKVSSRLPSKRLAYPAGGRYYFWDENPNPEQLLPTGDGKMTATEIAAAKAQMATVKIPSPYLSVPVAAGVANRSICILQPRVTDADGKKKPTALATFLSETSIPSSGQSILNLSRYPIYLTVSEKGDYSDKKNVMIKACADMKNIDAGNIYNFSGSAGQKISYILNVKLPDKAEPTRIRASSFVLSNKQVQVALILSDPNKPSVKMEVIQVMRASTKS